MNTSEFIYTLRTHIEDTDFAGVVYHSNYIKFMERARSEWTIQEGIGLDWQRKHKIYLPVHSMEIQFLKPAGLHECIEVVSRITSLRRASMVFDQYLRLAEDVDKILCKAIVKVACTDEAFQPRALPDAPFFDSIRRLLT